MTPRIETWKEIAAHVGRSVWWCQRAARWEGKQRLPVFYVGRTPAVTHQDLAVWDKVMMKVRAGR